MSQRISAKQKERIERKPNFNTNVRDRFLWRSMYIWGNDAMNRKMKIKNSVISGVYSIVFSVVENKIF